MEILATAFLGCLLGSLGLAGGAGEPAAAAAVTSTTSPGAVAAAVLTLLFAWALARRLTMLDMHRVPAPWGLPLVGQVAQVALHMSNAHELFLAWHEAYGPVVRLRVLYKDVVLVADPGVAAEVLAKGPNECRRRTPEYTIFNAAHGMGKVGAMLTEQSEERWKAIRRTIAPAYTLSSIRDLFPTVVSCYADVCRRISSGASLRYTEPGVPEVLVDEEVFAATLNVLADGFLGMPRGGRFDAHETAAAAASLVSITNQFVTRPWKHWAYLAAPGLCKESRDFHAQRAHMVEVTRQVAEHVLARRPAPLADSSLAACLARLAEPGSGEPFSKEALQAEVFLEIVGQESVPWTVAWALYLLTQHPEAEAAMVAELRAAGVPCCGDVDAAAAALSMDLLKQLPFCTAVLNEAMRLFPAGVSASPRLAEQETQVGPYRIPAGVIIFPNLFTLLNYSGNWDSPREFKPERWLEPGYATHPTTGAQRFVPFGIGPKTCVAQHLAMVQLKVLMVLLVSCFSWSLAPRMGGPETVRSQTIASLELRVPQGMWLTPRPRAAKDGGSS